MGEYGWGNINDNGEGLVDVCLNNRCVIGDTFSHIDIHKMTWKTPDGHTVNQMDHIVNNKWRIAKVKVKL